MVCHADRFFPLYKSCRPKMSFGSHMIGVHTCFNDITPDYKVEKHRSALFSQTTGVEPLLQPPSNIIGCADATRMLISFGQQNIMHNLLN